MVRLVSAKTDRRTALITGASAGIGTSFAHRLAADGWELILTARRAEKLEAIAEEIRGKYRRSVEVIPADLAVREDLHHLESRLRGEPSLEMLVNNAGFGVSGEYVRQPIEKHQRMIDVHITATVRLTHAALEGMLERRRGYIINVSSIAAFIPVQGGPGYSASKAYLNSFSTNLAAQVLRRGVRVQALCPGYTLTEFHSTPDYQGKERESLPSWVWMSADEVVAYSLSSLDSGQVIVIPGFKNRLISYFLRSRLGAFVMGYRSRFLGSK